MQEARRTSTATKTNETHPSKGIKTGLTSYYLAWCCGLIVGTVNGALTLNYLSLLFPLCPPVIITTTAAASFICNLITFTRGIPQLIQSFGNIGVHEKYPVTEEDTAKASEHNSLVKKALSTLYKGLVNILGMLSNLSFAFLMFSFGYNNWQQVFETYNISGATAYNTALILSTGFASSVYLALLDPTKSTPDITYSRATRIVSFIGSSIQSIAFTATLVLVIQPLTLATLPAYSAYTALAFIGITCLKKNFDFYNGRTKQVLHELFAKNGAMKSTFASKPLSSISLIVLILLNALGSAATTRFARLPIWLANSIIANSFFASVSVNLSSAASYIDDIHSWPASLSDSARLGIMLASTVACSALCILTGPTPKVLAFTASYLFTAGLLSFSHYGEHLLKSERLLSFSSSCDKSVAKAAEFARSVLTRTMTAGLSHKAMSSAAQESAAKPAP